MSFLRKKNLNILFLVGLSLLASGIQAKESSKTLEELMAELQNEAPVVKSVQKEAPVAQSTKQASSKTLEQLLAELQNEVSVSTGTQAVAAGKEEEEGDRYVQTTAHLQLDEVKNRVAKFPLYAKGAIVEEGTRIKKSPNQMVTPYLNLVASVIKKEVELAKTHYAFYHGETNQWRVPQDLYKLLYAYYNPLNPVKDFTFIRFTDMPLVKAQDYLAGHVKKYAGVNDNEDKTILPVNLALFGGVGDPGECTWNYFIMSKSHKWPVPETYQTILDAFKLSYDRDALVAETGELSEMLVNGSDEQTILQIFIPKEIVDDIGFLAWIIGFPAHPKSMELVEAILGDKPRVGKFTARAVKKLMKQYQKEGENNPHYKELMDAVENGDFGIDAFLKVYRNTPWELKNPNQTQARLMITNEGLLNPKSGVKYFTYFTTPKEIQDNYLKKLNALAKKIINANEESANEENSATE